MGVKFDRNALQANTHQMMTQISDLMSHFQAIMSFQTTKCRHLVTKNKASASVYGAASVSS